MPVYLLKKSVVNHLHMYLMFGFCFHIKLTSFLLSLSVLLSPFVIASAVNV